jgi:hypothetical protein
MGYLPKLSIHSFCHNPTLDKFQFGMIPSMILKKLEVNSEKKTGRTSNAGTVNNDILIIL